MLVHVRAGGEMGGNCWVQLVPSQVHVSARDEPELSGAVAEPPKHRIRGHRVKRYCFAKWKFFTRPACRVKPVTFPPGARWKCRSPLSPQKVSGIVGSSFSGFDLRRFKTRLPFSTATR